MRGLKGRGNLSFLDIDGLRCTPYAKLRKNVYMWAQPEKVYPHRSQISQLQDIRQSGQQAAGYQDIRISGKNTLVRRWPDTHYLITWYSDNLTYKNQECSPVMESKQRSWSFYDLYLFCSVSVAFLSIFFSLDVKLWMPESLTFCRIRSTSYFKQRC